MEKAQATRFLTQFSRAVFQQWTETPGRDQFWNDEAFVHSMLTEAVAKLPHGKLHAQLVSNRKEVATELMVLLRDLYVDDAKKRELEKENESWTHDGLLNKELTELELMRAAAAGKQKRLANVLALDAGVDVVQYSADGQMDNAEELGGLFALIAARNYETPLEQKHKRGLILKRLALCAQKVVEKLCSGSGNWSCEENEGGNQVQQLRAVLERVVVQDTVALAREAHEKGEGALEAPWTMFYRPEERNELKKVSYDNEMAKIYGVLLTLAVYFPIENNEEEETSDESSTSGDEEEESTQEPQKQISALAQAQLTTRQVLLAAQMRQRRLDQNNLWLVLVLSFLQSLHKPATYLDGDGDEALDDQGRHKLLDCVGDVYTRAFANAALFGQAKESASEEKTAVQDRGLFEVVVCLRHAAQFMRVERRSSLPTITTAMAQLAGVFLPASFVSWLDHEQTANPKSVLEKATQRLWKKCAGQNRMANILLSSTDVSDDEMCMIRRKYLEYLDQLAQGNANTISRQANANSSAEAEEVVSGDLFYVDNAGGEYKEKASKSKTKRANRKKKRVNKTVEVSLAKRSCPSSN